MNKKYLFLIPLIILISILGFKINEKYLNKVVGSRTDSNIPIWGTLIGDISEQTDLVDLIATSTPDLSAYLKIATATEEYVPYTGASDNLDLGLNSVAASNLSGTNTGDETSETIGTLINSSTSTTTPAEYDKFAIFGSVSSALQNITWTNLKSSLKSYFDTIYLSILTDGTPDTDHTANGPQTSTFNSGYSSTAMDLVYMGSGGKWLATDADSSATSTGMLAIALEAKTDGQAMKVATAGSYVRDDSWNFATGTTIYVSTDLGQATSTQPSGTDDVIRVIGFAVNPDVIYFNPSSDYLTHN